MQALSEQGEDGGPGLLPALRRFLRERPEWSVIYHTQANHGFTVISRDERDKPALPGKLQMAANFAKVVAAHVADGAKKVELEVLEQRLEVCSLCDQRTDERCGVYCVGRDHRLTPSSTWSASSFPSLSAFSVWIRVEASKLESSASGLSQTLSGRQLSDSELDRIADLIAAARIKGERS